MVCKRGRMLADAASWYNYSDQFKAAHHLPTRARNVIRSRSRLRDDAARCAGRRAAVFGGLPATGAGHDFWPGTALRVLVEGPMIGTGNLIGRARPQEAEHLALSDLERGVVGELRAGIQTRYGRSHHFHLRTRGTARQNG